jgi:hypothetical protein
MTMNCPITNPMDLKRLSAPALLCCAELLASTPARAAGEWVPLSQFQLWPNTPGDTAVRVIPIAAPIVNPAGCADPDSYFVPTTIAKEVMLSKPRHEIGASCHFSQNGRYCRR